MDNLAAGLEAVQLAPPVPKAKASYVIVLAYGPGPAVVQVYRGAASIGEDAPAHEFRIGTWTNGELRFIRKSNDTGPSGRHCNQQFKVEAGTKHHVLAKHAEPVIQDRLLARTSYRGTLPAWILAEYENGGKTPSVDDGDCLGEWVDPQIKDSLAAFVWDLHFPKDGHVVALPA